MRDQVFAEAAAGNMAPLAYFLSIYPIAGDLAASAVSELKGRKRRSHGVDRFVDAFTNLGALGLVQSLAISSKFNDIPGFVGGPTVSDILRMGEGSINYITSGRYQQLERAVMRQPFVRAGRDLVEMGHRMYVGDVEKVVGTLSKKKGSTEPVTLERYKVKAIIVSDRHALLPFAWRLRKEGVDIKVVVFRDRFEKAWEGILPKALSGKEKNREGWDKLIEEAQDPDTLVITDSRKAEAMFKGTEAKVLGSGPHQQFTDIPALFLVGWFNGEETQEPMALLSHPPLPQ
jgi:hypothetical protein